MFTNPPPPKIVPFMSMMSKIEEWPERLYDNMTWWISKTTRAHAHAHDNTPANPHTWTHTEICNTYCFSTATIFS